MKDKKTSYQSTQKKDHNEHPSGADLYNFFSASPARQLGIEENKRITAHVALCPECTSIGKSIKMGDVILDAMLSTPETAEDKAALERSLKWFRITPHQMTKSYRKDLEESIEFSRRVKEAVEFFMMEKIFWFLKRRKVGLHAVLDILKYESSMSKEDKEVIEKELEYRLIKWYLRKKQENVLPISTKSSPQRDGVRSKKKIRRSCKRDL